MEQEVAETEKNQEDKNEPRRGTPAKCKRRADEARLDQAFKILKRASESAQQEGNECEIFGNLVAKKLAKYSSDLQSVVQQDIMNILFQADRTHVSNNSIPYHSPHSYYTSNFIQNTIGPQTLPQSPLPSPSSQFLHPFSHQSPSSQFSQPSPLPSQSHNSSMCSSDSSNTVPDNTTSTFRNLNMPDLNYEG